MFTLLLLGLLVTACGGQAAPQPTQQPANTSARPTDTPIPPTNTPLPPTATPVPPIATTAPTQEAMTPEQKEAADLWQRLQDADYRGNWSLVPGKGEFYAGQGPHGLLLTTYLNEAAFNTLESKPGAFPDGAILVKENYMPDKTLAAITVMLKKPGFDPDHNDWFFAKYGPDGSVQAAGSPAGCVACHGAVRSNDYVYTFPVAPITPPQVETNDAITQKAANLWQKLQDADYQNNWILVPGKGELYAGQGPHGMLLTTYLNEAAFNTLESKPGAFPDGAILVKENYMPDKTLAAITVMVKEKDFAPSEGDWFFVKFGPDGAIQAAGQPAGCVACHGAVRSNDFVYTFPVAPIPPAGPPPPVSNASMSEKAKNKSREGGEEKTDMGDEIPPEKPDMAAVVALVKKGGCAGCHTIAGIQSALGDLGPEWCGVAKEYQAGKIDLAFIRQAINDPNAEIAENFPANIMPQNFGDLFTTEEINTLAAFIATMECE